jgi:DNA polymerase-3 subunit delta
MQKEFDEVIRDLGNKIYYPLYILEGDEPYYIDEVSYVFENKILSETEKSFNLNVVYGRDVDDNDIATLARAYPMFGSYQVIIVKEAQNVKSWEAVEAYSTSPLKSTVLVLCFMNDKLDKRKKGSKELIRNAVVLTTKRLYDNQVPGWIDKYLKDKEYKISSRASALIADYCGTELSKIVNELEKLMLNVPKEKEITHEHIEKYIGIHKEYNVFEFTKAIGIKDVLKANRIALYFSENEKNNPLVVTIASLYSYFNKLMMFHQLSYQPAASVAAQIGVAPFFVKEYEAASKNYPPHKLVRLMHLLNEYDLRSKSIIENTTSGGELLRELVFKILH